MRHWRAIVGFWREPGSIPVKLRSTLIEVWGARGGGFYGVGYVVAFVYFEISMVLEDLLESSGADAFILGTLAEYVFRFSVMSFVNVFRALLWPLMVAGSWDGLGVLVLLGAYFSFEYLLKPRINDLFPELTAQRLAKQAQKQNKKEQKKRRKISRKKSGRGEEA